MSLTDETAVEEGTVGRMVNVDQAQSDNRNAKIITPLDGYAPHVGSLLSMLRLTRQSTIEHVHGLPVAALAWRPDDTTNSIGMLLGHMAAVERLYQLRHLENRAPNHDERGWLEPRKALGPEGFEATRHLGLADLLADLACVRERTFWLFRSVDDAALLDPFEYRGGLVNLFRQFFHVMEDELRHTGQVRLLLKRLR